MRRGFRQRHAVARKLSQRHDRKVPARCTHGTCRSKSDAAHAYRRSPPGTTEGKERGHSVRKIVASHCRSTRKTATDYFVSEPARVFNVAAMQQLWRSTQLP